VPIKFNRKDYKMADDDKKVFDVAKPGSSKPTTGTKPMVIGHKSLAQDPSINVKASENPPVEPKTTDDNIVDSKVSAPPSQKKRVIVPLSDTTSNTEDNKADTEQKPSSSSEVAEIKSSTPDSTNLQSVDETTSVIDKKDAPKDKEKDAGDIQLEREEHLQELIKSKKYAVNIKEKRSFGLKTFILTILGITILGAIVVVLLIDADIIDLGIKLPFDLIK